MTATPAPRTPAPRTVVVIGHGMVGHRFLTSFLAACGGDWQVVTFCEEPVPAYDRVMLSSLFEGAEPGDLTLVDDGFLDDPRLVVHLGEAAAGIDRDAKVVTSTTGREITYDALVLATGSYPFVPPIPGNDAPGCFVYRTLDDVAAITEASRGKSVGAVIGGGLLGLEAANALKGLGLTTHVIEFAPRLMAVQLDEAGGAALRGRIEDLGVTVRTGAQTTQVLADTTTGEVTGLRFAEGDDLDCEIVVFSAGIRPRDQLAADCGLDRHERGGILVDERMRTSDPSILAIGECAVAQGRIWGLVAPGYDMAKVAVDTLLGGERTFTGADMSTKLKLLGIGVASFGDAFGTGAEDAREVTLTDPVTSTYAKVVVDTSNSVIGGMLVGDTSRYATLAAMARGDLPTPAEPATLLVSGTGEPAGAGLDALPDSALICSCNSVSKGAICGAIAEGYVDVPSLKKATTAGTGCGGCVPQVTDLLKTELRKAGVAVNDHLCAHFPYSRVELFDLVRVHQIDAFADLLGRFGTGRGCEICRPAVASMLASRANGYILDGEQAALQDSNDHFLANIQRDGTYSIVPRVPGGEITPDQLITIGQVAKDYGLYTKITGGQRIDLFGAQAYQLPEIWEKLIAVGLESGHAYGKALRTVKSCVGDTWCRYGVQDSTSLAIDLELRYRGLRAPHKIKMAVSGCVRECAEAQGKDVGVIATERGWNLWVAGNGGAKPQHAVLFAEDLDTATLVTYIDRFLMFYVRTADRLERTATWFNKLEGGLDHLRAVIVDDSLGINADLEAEMDRHVATYECEWTATVNDPARRARFANFVNAPGGDPDVAMVRQRDQIRPAYPHERGTPVTLGSTR